MRNESIDSWMCPEWEDDDSDTQDEIEKEIEIEKLLIKAISGSRKRALEQLED